MSVKRSNDSKILCGRRERESVAEVSLGNSNPVVKQCRVHVLKKETQT